MIVLDTETTGLDAATDRVVELAVIDFYSHTHWESLVDPQRPIGIEAMATHHITELMCHGKPSLQWAVDQTWDKFDCSTIVAHNAKFDKGFVGSYYSGATWICTYKCAVMTWPNAPRHTNQVLRYYLGLKPEVPEGLAPHRALYDIIVTKEILRELLKHNDLDQLIAWSNGPILLPKVPFGKHAGKKWIEVDRGYLSWILKNITDNEDMIYTAEYYLRGGR